MAGYNRKHATYCAWCGEPVWSDGVRATVRNLDRPERRATYAVAHAGECMATFATVMRSNAYSVTYREETNR